MKFPTNTWWQQEVRMWLLLCGMAVSVIALVLLAIKHNDATIALMTASGVGCFYGFLRYGLGTTE